MRISRKAISISLIAAAMILVAFVVALNSLIEHNRGRLREEIQKSLGRSLTFDQLRLSLWGGLGLSAQRLRIDEDPRFAATPFIQTKELRMQVQWLPLLLGKIVIKKFILEEPEIQIIRNEEGILNLSALARQSQEREKMAERGEKRSGLDFLVSAIDVRNGRIDYIDRSFKEPVEIRIHKADLDFKGLTLSGITKISLSANFFDGQAQNIYLEGQVGPLQNGKHWSEQPMELDLRIDSLLLAQLTRAIPFLREKIPELGIVGPLKLQAKLSGNFERPRVRDLTFSGPFFGATENNTTIQGGLDFSKGTSWSDGEIQGTLSVDSVQLGQLKKIAWVNQSLPAVLTSEGPLKISSHLQGSLDNLRIAATVRGERAEIRFGDWLNKPSGVSAQLELNLERKKDLVAFRESTLTLNNLKLNFSGLVEDSPERRLTLKLQTDGVGLGGWDKLLPPLAAYNTEGKVRWDLSIQKNLGPRDQGLEIRGMLNLDEVFLKDKKTGRSIEQLKGQLTFRGKEARVDDASFRLASTVFALQGLVPNLAQPSLRYVLNSPRLKLTDLTGISAYKTDEFQGLMSTGELRFSDGAPALLGRFSSAEGTFQGILYRNLRADIAWSPKNLSFKNLSFQALSGSLRANGSWKTGDESAQRLDFASQIESMDLKALLSQKFPKFKDHIEGRVDFRAQLRAETQNGTSLQEKVTGEGETQVRGGALRDFNIVEQVLSKVGGLPGISKLSSRLLPRYSAVLNRRDTPFETLQATFVVEQERIRTDNLILATADYTINGEGWIGFDKTTKWNAVLVMSPQFTQDLMQEHRNVRYMVDRQGRLAVPFRLEGTLPNVQAKPDVRALGETLQRGLLRKGSGRALGDEKDPKKKARRDRIQKGLERLLGK